jgi:hypothetical protein
MAKKQKQAKQVEVTVVEAPEAKAVRASRLRLPLPEAKAHNVKFVPVNPKQAVAANVALTSKGTNPKRSRVYGYDNLSNGGGVPKDKKVVVVPGAQLPKGVNASQWDLLTKEATGSKTVVELYNAKIASRTIRRAYRAGAIRFAA